MADKYEAYCVKCRAKREFEGSVVELKNGRKAASDNPWQSTTLEWQTPTPPPHGNFAHAPEVHRGPYEYSVPGHATDFTPQNEPEEPARG